MKHFVKLSKASLLFSAFWVLPIFCTPSADPEAEVFRITSRGELIGGPRALGEVGDYMLQNDQIRVIVQDKGYSRGFGIYGGSIIDADLVRARGTHGNSATANGYDNFGEMFPSFFLEAMEPNSITVVGDSKSDEEDQADAIAACGEPEERAVALHVRAYGSDFLAMTESINEVLLGDDRSLPALQFDTCYRLAPGDRYIEIETTVTNIDISPKTFPGVTSFGDIPTPVGDIMLFGAGNKLFMPHKAGYDQRFALQELYESGEIELPAFPGLVGDYLAAEGPHVSYGLVRAPAEAPALDFAHNNKSQFAGTAPHSLHIPFVYSAFTGIFQALPPSTLPAGDSFKFKRYFIVGGGSVSDISDVAFDLIGTRTGLVSGKVVEDQTHQPVEKARVVIVAEDGRKVTSSLTDATGRFGAQVPAGKYGIAVQFSDRHTPAHTQVEVKEGARHFENIVISAPAKLSVRVVSKTEGPLPAKVTLVGESELAHKGWLPREYLFDLKMGETRRYTDMVEDTDDPATRQYIEKFKYTEPDGTLVTEARPGKYKLVVSRGMEYGLFERDVELVAGQNIQVSAEIERLLDTSGYLSADFHLHSQYSLDSGHSLDKRVKSFAGEGLEYAVSTDHNFVVDYADTIAHLDLNRWVNSAIGLELTTLDRGHFNGFPLESAPIPLSPSDEYQGAYENTIATRTYGSFEWNNKTPQEVFDALRAMGAEGEEALVQVNHPRSPILGYFSQYNVDADNLMVKGETGLLAPNSVERPQYSAANFSWDFDVIEVLNAKDFTYFHTYRIPDGVTVDESSGCPVTPGEVHRNWTSTCEPEEGEAPDPDCECVPGDPAWPGVIEDWFQVLRTGKKVVGTANSDSHDPHKTEPGMPRTFVASASDSPIEVKPGAIRDQLKAGRALMTNGPYVTVKVSGETEGGMGDTVQARDGKVTVEMRLQAVPWVVVDRLVVFYNGQEVEVDASIPSASEGKSLDKTISFDVPVSKDGFMVFELSGAQSMFPAIFPSEVPPLEFSDVVGNLGSSFGIDFGGGALKPAMVHQATPFALTNPVWIDADGDGEIAPDMPLPALPAAQMAAQGAVDPPESMSASERRAYTRSHNEQKVRQMPAYRQHAFEHVPPWLWPSNHPSDVRRIFMNFTCPH